jgi:hypothetical protein
MPELKGFVKGKWFTVLISLAPMKQLQFCDKLQCVYNADESGFPVNDRTPKILSKDAKRVVVSLTRRKGR